MPTLETLYSVDSNVHVINYKDFAFINQLESQPGVVKMQAAPIFEVILNDVPCRVLWDEQWYTYFQLPFSLRYKGFTYPHQLPGSAQLFDKTVKQDKYILVHREMGPNRFKCPIDLQGWRSHAGLDDLSNYQIIEIDASLSNNMMDYMDLIKNASEIHCVPSSMHCLVDSVNTQTNAQLFFHKIRKDNQMRINNTFNNHRWCYINYQEKF